jgi:AcrR family transcriptional regulator
MTTNFTARQLQIIQESITLIAEKGIQGLTMKNLASAIGVSEPALYRHFKSKNDILSGIIEQMKTNTGKNLDLSSQFSVLEKLEKVLLTHTVAFIANPSLTAIVFSEDIFRSDNVLSAQIKNMMMESQQKFTQIINQGQERQEIRTDIDANQLSLYVVGAFRLLVTKWHLLKHNFNLLEEAQNLISAQKILLTP